MYILYNLNHNMTVSHVPTKVRNSALIVLLEIMRYENEGNLQV